MVVRMDGARAARQRRARKAGTTQRTGEASFEAAFHTACIPMAISRLRDAVLIEVNDAFCEQTGYSRSEAVGRTADELGVLGDPEERRAVVRAVREHGVARDVEWTVKRRSGEVRSALLSASTIEVDGEPCLLTALADVTELRRSEERYRNLFEQTADGVVLIDEQGRISDVNPALAAFMGRSVEELRGTPWIDYIDNLDEVPYRQPAYADPGAPVFERRLRRPDGSIVELEFHARQFAPGWSIGVGREIGARKAAERERARLIRAVEQSADAIAITDPAGTIVYVNPALERMSQMTLEQASGQSHRALLSEALPQESYDEILATVTREGHWSGELARTRPDGSPFFAQVTVTAVNDESGKLANYVIVLREMTREHELEEQLRQAQKMEAIGRLAGGVAHDFNNLLTAISGFTELAAAQAEPGSELAGYLDEVQQSAERAASLTRQLLAFGRRAVLQPRVLDVNEVVAQVAPMLERIIGEDVALEIRLGEKVGRAMADRGQMEQVIVNLAANARDAMPAGGKLTISTETVSLDAAYAAAHPGVQPGDYVRLSFTDTGTGMDAATMEHIFEPFFTTKMAGSGTGLGLATVFGIVRQSGGLVDARSAPGQGSTFIVDLPVTTAKAEPDGEARRAQSEPGHETLLVVEDEPSVLGFVSQLLTRHGYTVLGASSGDEAVALAESHPGPIDLLFCDLVMPGLSGRETASVVQTLRPDIRHLFSSGYSEEMARRGTADEFPFVGKPYDADTLLRAIREALAGLPRP
jgi:two-component system cell cycle sensor histidine kinase/response regulator CckA